jgi:hypothetical protein
MEGIRRLTKTIQVYRTEQAVPIDFRLPGDAKRCIGLQAVVVGHIPTVRPVIPVFGEYSLEFEGKKVHPVNFIVPYVSQQGFDEETHHRPGLLPLSVAIEDNRLVTGFYRDLGAQDMADDRGFAPYSVRFTFSLHVNR